MKKKSKMTDKSAEELFAEGMALRNAPPSRRDYGKAFELFTRAAELGSVEAVNMLGLCWWNGEGVPADNHRAAVHFLRAAQAGCTDAMFNIGLFMNGQGKGCRMGKERAIHWFEMAADRGNRDAMWEMGYAYLNGDGVDVDYSKAEEWFADGSDCGNASCMVQLGLMRFRGDGCKVDYKGAAMLWQEAVKQDNSDAYLYLGYCYEHGKGVWRSLGKAYRHLSLSDAYGNVNASAEMTAFMKRHRLYRLCYLSRMWLKFRWLDIKYGYYSFKD